jgi:2-amino-4-hydroxy-6-hydroxymethyldihydropteridine diphosphokinase
LEIELSKTLSLHFTPHFPYSVPKRDRDSFKVLVSIGGNIGDTKRRFEKLFWRVKSDRNLRILETAPMLKNPPFGYLEQDDFFNSLILLETKLRPKAFLRRVLYLEKRFGRERTFKNAPRTLDIDIIFFGDFKIKSRDLTVPHQHWHERESVIIPLMHLGSSFSRAK